MQLKISAKDGMVTIDTPGKTGNTDFSFALLMGMYQGGTTPTVDGMGCQVNDEALRPDLEALCGKITDALREFGEKHPESGILPKHLLTTTPSLEAQ